MKSVKLDPSWDRTIEMSVTDAAVVVQAAQTFGSQTVPSTRSQLYGLFTLATEQVGMMLKDRVGSKEPVLPAIAEQLATYIRLGAAVSRIFSK
jgi:hypothetical protein